MSDEKKIENEITKYSVHRRNWNGFEWNELQKYASGKWVMIVAGDEAGKKAAVLWYYILSNSCITYCKFQNLFSLE